MELLNKLYISVAAQRQVDGIDDQFIPLSLKAMRKLQLAGRSNMVYGLIRCVALPDNAGTSSSRLPLDRMPTGYIEHQINSFDANHCSNVMKNVLH